MKWVLQYVMNYREPSGKAAAIGTICHYVLECVARAKRLKDLKKRSEKNDIVGSITPKYDIQKFIDKSYDFFSAKESHLAWTDADYREVCRNIKKAQAHDFFPENHKEIIQTEQFFNMKAESPWGEYAYVDAGTVEKGNVDLVGVIDLVFRDQDGILNVIDYKFGKPQDWNTGKNKDYASVIKDIQLCMYYYAMRNMFPDEDIMINLWYVKHQTIFSACFDQAQEDIILKKIKSCLHQIRTMEKPHTNYSYRCKLCSFSKTNFGDWGRPELDVDYNKVGHLSKFDDVKDKACMCDAAKIFIDYRGLEATVEAAKKGK